MKPAKTRVLVLYSAQAARYCPFNVKFFVGRNNIFQLLINCRFRSLLCDPKE